MAHDSIARTLSRRVLLLGGMAAVGLGVRSDRPRAPLATPRHLASEPNVMVEEVYSRARKRDVELVTMYPRGYENQHLPVCLMLHGRWGDARKSTSGIPYWLSQAVENGMPPYALLAVDGGGNSYWHHHRNDDPMRMLLEEVPLWLAHRGLAGETGQPFAVSGISMGGFGALLYTRWRHRLGDPVNAAAVVSPALLTTWREMSKRKAFRDEAEWAALDPLNHIDELGTSALGVWCGSRDRFITGTRIFIERAEPEYASTTNGGHNSRYYRHALPEVVRFVGHHVPDETVEDG